MATESVISLPFITPKGRDTAVPADRSQRVTGKGPCFFSPGYAIISRVGPVPPYAPETFERAHRTLIKLRFLFPNKNCRNPTLMQRSRGNGAGTFPGFYP